MSGGGNWLSPEVFDREFELRKIHSHYLVHLYCNGEYLSRPYVVMEYCGSDLRAALRDHTLPLSDVILDVLYGLRDLRQQHRCHGNLKIENILLRNDGTCVLTDFADMPHPNMATTTERETESYYVRDLCTLGLIVASLITDKHLSNEPRADREINDLVSEVSDGVAKWAPEWLPFIRFCLRDSASLPPDISTLIALIPGSAARNRPYRNLSSVAGRVSNAGSSIMIRVLDGPDYGAVFPLDELRTPQTPIITIGRSDETVWNVIRLTDLDKMFISRMHASIVWEDERRAWKLLDGQNRIKCPLGRTLHNTDDACSACPVACPSEFKAQHQTYQFVKSLNGVLINGCKVPDEGVILRCGDVITIGDSTLTVECY